MTCKDPLTKKIIAQILNLKISKRKPRMFYYKKSSTFVKLADTEIVLILVVTRIDVIFIRNKSPK